MTPSSAATSAVRIRPVRLAMERGDFDAADAALAELAGETGAIPPEAWAVAGALHLRRRRWPDAARLLGRIIEPDAESIALLTLARNLAALARHRPALCERLADVMDRDGGESGSDASTGGSSFRIAPTPSGSPTILWRSPDGKPISLSPHHDPRRALAESMRQLADAIERRQCIGVYGLGDGYLLAALAAHASPNAIGQQQCVHVIVDDEAHLLAAMRLHDYAGPRGPIAQPRMVFHVGGDWPDQLRRTFEREPTTPFPQTQATQGPQGAAIAPVATRIALELAEGARRLTASNHAHDAALAHDDLVDAFGDSPRRPPRVLAITSRFTTVLQYSTRDSLDAFERLGWRTKLLIEPAAHQQITPLSVIHAIDEFKPDLVFLIDHLRCEYGDRFPPQLPLICWVQDHLPNLTNAAAGATITGRDFVLTAMRSFYRDRVGYPDRQLIDVPKLTRVPRRPAAWASDGDDLAFVSNASAPVEEMIERTLQAAGDSAPMRTLLTACCDWVAAIYERGQSLPTHAYLRRVVEAAAAQTGVSVSASDASQIVRLLHHPLNDALYRRQALRWAKRIADERGLTLAIYGSGWQRLDEFAPHARGPIGYGDDLEAMTRRTKINLQIVPFSCTHQRLLDGLVAGGFFLVRRHAWDDMLAAVSAFLEAHVPPDATTTQAARAAIADVHRDAFDALIERFTSTADIGHAGDVVDHVRSHERTRQVEAGVVLPRLDEVAFTDRGSLATLIERFIADPDARRRVADEQRTSVEARLTYAAGMRRVVREIHDRLAGESSGSSPLGERLGEGERRGDHGASCGGATRSHEPDGMTNR